MRFLVSQRLQDPEPFSQRLPTYFTFANPWTISTTSTKKYTATDWYFQKQKFEDLKEIQSYDETMVRRLVATNATDGSAHLDFFLRSSDVSVLISDYDDHFALYWTFI